MDKDFFKGKRVTVLGLGLHGGGVGIVKFLAGCGAKVVVTDLKSKEELASSLEKLKDLKGVEFVLGTHRTEDFSNADMVIKNPVVRWDSPHIKIALEKKIPVEMDSSLFFKLCPNLIIGITGTKGKTTTASLVHSILRSAGRSVLKVGVGQVSVLDKLAELQKDTIVVFELSSWRLSALGREKLSPQIAVVTNLLPDHLNYYKSMAEYAADKENIFLHQKPKDWLIIGEGGTELEQMAKKAPAQIVKFAYQPIRNGRTVFLDGGALYLNDGNDNKKIISQGEIKLRGRHNLGNVMAAVGACFAAGLSPEEIRNGILEFKGVPHRLEFVRELDGVGYYNDTAATIPDAAVQALEAFTEPIVLIAGGSDKNLDFGGLARAIAARTKAAVFIKGIGTDKLTEAIRKIPGHAQDKFRVFDSMEGAVKAGRELSGAGDVVLLSPGAASFGVFLNEFDRGDKFKKAVNELK